MAYDFNRAYMDIDSLMAYKAVDREVGQTFGVVVLAVELSNREYQHRISHLRLGDHPACVQISIQRCWT